MTGFAEYNGPFTSVIHADADSPFGIYLAQFKGDDKNTFRFNVTTCAQGVQPGLCLASQPLSPSSLADSIAGVIRLLKTTEAWSNIKDDLSAQLD